MSTRLWLKLVFVLAMLLFMVLMGMSNRHTVPFRLNLLGVEVENVSAALMYYIFFGAGIVTGAVIVLGPWKAKGN